MDKKSIKLIKRHERALRLPAPALPVTNPTGWSTAVRSWILEFEQRDREESLPAFDSLFKDALPESAPAE
jgi:hypothetical protein